MGSHRYISGNATWLFRLFRLTYFSYFRYFSRYSRVIWICVEILKRIYKNTKIQWWTDQHRLMSRTPCNAVADHQGAADPWLKTPDIRDLIGQHLCCQLCMKGNLIGWRMHCLSRSWTFFNSSRKQSMKRNAREPNGATIQFGKGWRHPIQSEWGSVAINGSTHSDATVWMGS